MQAKPYKIPKNTSQVLSEPAVAYQLRPAPAEISLSNKWNPNVPFHGTQDEWWEHFHQIEEGQFTPLKEANKEFNEWKKEYLANRLK